MTNNDHDWQSTDQSLTKLAVAAMHVTASIQMIAGEVNPLTVQLAVLSADTIIQDVARHRRVALAYGDDTKVKPEYLKDWLVAKRRAVNYSKHADRDPDAIYAGPKLEGVTNINDMQTLMNIWGLEALGHPRPLWMTQFVYVVGLLHPSVLKWDQMATENPALAELVKNRPKPTREEYLASLRGLLRQQRQFPVDGY